LDDRPALQDSETVAERKTMAGARVSLVFFVVLGLATGVSALVSPAAPSPSRVERRGVTHEEPALATAVLVDVNRVRAAHGLGRLSPSPALRAAAELHSREMVKSGRFQHESPDGTPFWRRIARFYGSTGFGTWRVGENLIWSSPTFSASVVVRSWLASPPHRRIMLDPSFRELGVGAVRDTAAPAEFRGMDSTVVTADFGVRTH
jgi:uncharacterized protein YkwD